MPLSRHDAVDEACHREEDPWVVDQMPLDQQEAFDEWPCRLHQWLALPLGTLGELKAKRQESYKEMKAPLRPRAFIHQNLIRKAGAWCTEISNKLALDAPLDAPRMQLLGKALRRMPRERWSINVPPVLADGSLVTAEDFEQWYQNGWRASRAEVQAEL